MHHVAVSSGTLPCGLDARELQSSVVLPSGNQVLTHALSAVNIYSFSSMRFLQGGPQGAVTIF